MQILGRLAPVALLAATALVASGCSALSDDSPQKDGVLSVAAGFYPLAWVAEQVGGEHVKVSNLTRPGQEAHDSELSLKATATLAQADVIIVSNGFQPAIDDSVKANATGTVIDVADHIDFLPVAEHDDAHGDHADEQADEHTHDDGHDHGTTDPHFWLDPLLMADFAVSVGDEFAQVDPERASDYTDAAAAVADELRTLDADYTKGLASCEVSTVVVSHDAFGYLRRYGLTFEPVAGLSPGAEPTPADLAHLSQVIKDEKITTVFSETLAPTRLTEQLAADAGITTAILDPIEGLVDSASDDDYISLMRNNLAALTKANRC